MAYGGFNKVCANNIGRFGIVWGLFSLGNGVFSSFLGGMLGSCGPVLGTPRQARRLWPGVVQTFSVQSSEMEWRSDETDHITPRDERKIVTLSPRGHGSAQCHGTLQKDSKIVFFGPFLVLQPAGSPQPRQQASELSQIGSKGAPFVCCKAGASRVLYGLRQGRTPCIQFLRLAV